MAPKLKTYVSVVDPDGASRQLGPSDEVPSWAAEQITNPSAWENPDDAPKPRPKAEPAPVGQFGPAGKMPTDAEIAEVAQLFVDKLNEALGADPSEVLACIGELTAKVDALAVVVDELQAGATPANDGEGADGAQKPEVIGDPPPKSGAGSTTEAWAEYARANGFDIADDAKREDIFAALDDAGIPTEA